MSRLSDIPVRVEPPRTPEAGTGGSLGGGLGGGIAAVLSELAALLERLAAADETATIDLSSLPMSDADRIELQRVLGDGEVHATLRAQGLSTVRETGFSGVWWIEHRDSHGERMAELLEVARFPQILASAPDEIQAAAGALRSRNSRAPVDVRAPLAVHAPLAVRAPLDVHASLAAHPIGCP